MRVHEDVEEGEVTIPIWYSALDVNAIAFLQVMCFLLMEVVSKEKFRTSNDTTTGYVTALQESLGKLCILHILDVYQDSLGDIPTSPNIQTTRTLRNNIMRGFPTNFSLTLVMQNHLEAIEEKKQTKQVSRQVLCKH